ncbi:HECT domain [Dillenia turbinata]|uniref:HECT-type E3 ubiquitin transferase n=1 Tax=Dillenia turbinata TaxID=194707 RepID=A0AAN8W9P0_9MAGN
MDERRRHQVSLRGASAREISRDALLEKVSHERELRNYTRRATAAALFIQRVWRRYNSTRIVAMRLKGEWEALVKDHDNVYMTRTWISNSILRPFLFFVTFLSFQCQRNEGDVDCIRNGFQILMESIASTDPNKNFCSLATGTLEERRIWTYQAKRLICFCSFILGECDSSRSQCQEIVMLASSAMRLLVILTDPKGWKGINNEDLNDANKAANDLVQFLGSSQSGFYLSIRRYICKLDASFSSPVKGVVQSDDGFLVAASAITLALRPFHITNLDRKDCHLSDSQSAAEQFFVLLLTIPWFPQRIPTVLVPALRHKSVLTPCFRSLMVLKEKMLVEIAKIDQYKTPIKVIPPVGWALANIVYLAIDGERNSVEPQRFTQGFDLMSYVHVGIILLENLLTFLEDVGSIKQDDEPCDDTAEAAAEPLGVILRQTEVTFGSAKMSFIDLFRPVCQQWHLMDLLAASKKDASRSSVSPQKTNFDHPRKLELLDIIYFYSHMLQIFSILNPMVGSLPLLNILSFTPRFLVNLWIVLEDSLSLKEHDFVIKDDRRQNKVSSIDGAFEKIQKRSFKDGSNKWVNVLHKITGKSPADVDHLDSYAQPGPSRVDEDTIDAWHIEPLRRGPQGVSKDISCLLHLFCASYSHLLLVLDDIEFYEKQIPFTLEQQRKIAAMLNTLVYNGLTNNSGQHGRAIMRTAIRCLHLLYERDCRHQFCPPALWLSPAKKNRPPVATAARAHDVLSADMRSEDASDFPSVGSVITTTPHVFPFEERVQMFRELIKMDKVSRRMAGEVSGPGPGSVEIVVRRGHIVEDGFQQLNSLGSKLKSSIHVSFVSECGLPEAGLDYGGLSKEFLTDLSKAAFSPEYGLFSQTSTSDRHLIPNTAARFLENGIQMIEFLGRVVGKALYEGILLDYSFSHIFVQKLLGRYSFVDELSTLDPELYRNLMFVKHYDGDVKELSLDFTVMEELFGKQHVIELKPGGKDVPVTNENKLQYVHAIADYKLNRQILPFSNAFYRGLTDLIFPSWLKLFNASEFNQLLSGGNHDIDIDDLRRNTRYTGGYSESSRTVKLFWEVITGFEPKERCLLLKFVTSCSRAPLLGFKYLQPTFTIHKVACDVPLWATIAGQDVDRLPSASTCYNTLKLPTYKRPSTLRAKLLYAINSNAGFELS